MREVTVADAYAHVQDAAHNTASSGLQASNNSSDSQVMTQTL
jgi:hypothetical protein